MIERLFQWTCDFCEETVQTFAWGLPEGWIYLKAILIIRKEIQHACPECRNKFPREEWGDECKAKISA